MNFFADGEAPGGIGEPVTALMAATNANAVANIAGKRPRRLPRIPSFPRLWPFPPRRARNTAR